MNKIETITEGIIIYIVIFSAIAAIILMASGILEIINTLFLMVYTNENIKSV